MAPTPKRHFAYSSSGHIQCLDKGKLNMVQWRAKQDKKVKTARKTINAAGKEGYQGTPALRETEQPV